jgi:hypothetical protein
MNAECSHSENSDVQLFLLILHNAKGGHASFFVVRKSQIRKFLGYIH